MLGILVYGHILRRICEIAVAYPVLGHRHLNHAAFRFRDRIH